jgi:hypothetical protein
MTPMCALGEGGAKKKKERKKGVKNELEEWPRSYGSWVRPLVGPSGLLVVLQ